MRQADIVGLLFQVLQNGRFLFLHITQNGIDHTRCADSVLMAAALDGLNGFVNSGKFFDVVHKAELVDADMQGGEDEVFRTAGNKLLFDVFQRQFAADDAVNQFGDKSAVIFHVSKLTIRKAFTFDPVRDDFGGDKTAVFLHRDGQ